VRVAAGIMLDRLLGSPNIPLQPVAAPDV
jgi:hypothetical protein